MVNPDTQNSDSYDKEVVDPAEEEDLAVSNSKYQITSYGADYTVDSLVLRINRGDIYVPSFQRGYVWSLNQASKFIESLLLGLPVPGIFLSRDDDKKLLVIDGQQRLKTLQRFYKGVFDDRKFALRNVRIDYENASYDTLPEEDRRQLDDSILHATIIQQTLPEDDDSSIYHIFERLNTGGTRLQPQEIRVSIYHGKFIELLKELNTYPGWRNIYGATSKRSKDQELILRFLALYFLGHKYRKPLNEFLNTFTNLHRQLDQPDSLLLAPVFKQTIDVVDQSLGKTAFRSQRVLNAAAFDSIMVGIAKRLEQGPVHDFDQVKNMHDMLLQDISFSVLYTGSTTDESNVTQRIDIAVAAFADIP